MNEDARSILNNSILGSIATVNEDGSPWSTPVHVFSDEDSVYWFSDEDKQHSVNLDRDSRVSLTLFSPDTARGPKGIYVNGAAEKLGVDATSKAKEIVSLRLGKVPEVFAQATGYRLQIGTLDDSKSTSNCWYFYT